MCYKDHLTDCVTYQNVEVRKFSCKEFGLTISECCDFKLEGMLKAQKMASEKLKYSLQGVPKEWQANPGPQYQRCWHCTENMEDKKKNWRKSDDSLWPIVAFWHNMVEDLSFEKLWLNLVLTVIRLCWGPVSSACYFSESCKKQKHSVWTLLFYKMFQWFKIGESL